MSFKDYFKQDEDVLKTISKLPKAYQKLLKDYKFIFEPGNTLDGDSNHVGMIRNQPDKPKIIKVSSSWGYPKEHVFLHEIGHLIYETFVRGTKLEKEWDEITKNTKNKKKETSEENFCHGFAGYYAKTKIVLFNHEDWAAFMERLEKHVT